MKKAILLFAFLHLSANFLFAQVNLPNDGNSPGLPTVIDALPGAYPSGIKLNSQRTFTLQVPTADPQDIATLTANKATITTIFSDGFDRKIQTVHKASNPSLKDVVDVDIYDSYGRKTLELLNYASAENKGDFKRNAIIEQANYYKSNPPDIAEGDGDFPYSKIKYDDASLERTVSNFQPGISKVGQDHGNTKSIALAGSGEQIRMWEFAGINSAPVSGGLWSNLSVFVIEAINANGKKSRTYKNKDGKTILVKTESSPIHNSPYDGWMCTYLVYDDYGRLRNVLPPKAVDAIKNSNWIVTPTVLDKLCYSYDYDSRSRTISKKLPGQEPILTVYDNADHPVLFQDGNLSNSNQWLFQKYDNLGRVIIEGKFLNNSGLTTVQIRNILSGSSVPSNAFLAFVYNPINTNTFTISNSIPDAEIYRLSYFDNYSYAPVDMDYDDAIVQSLPTAVNSVSPIFRANAYGLNTVIYTRVMDGNNPSPVWMNNVMYYDTKGQVIQVQSHNFKGGHDTVSIRYNFVGSPVSMLLAQENPSVFASEVGHVRIWKLLSYDQSGRLTSTSQKINDEPYWRRLNALSYNGVGNKVIKKMLGKDAESQAYKFRIWGALESINKDFCENGNGGNFFGEVVNYDYGFTYTDNVLPAGMTWRMKGSSNLQRAYGYKYDYSGRLASADYNQLRNVGVRAWTNYAEDYSAKNISYDPNGNITHMDQYGTKPGVGVFLMDQMEYTYKDGGVSNQLEAVTDAVTADYGLGEFTEPNNTNTVDYSYDKNGNASSDANKDITGILFTNHDKPYQIDFTGGRSIKFTYDANGTLLSKEIIEPSQQNKITDYVGLLEYSDNKLVSINHDEGRCRPVIITLSNGIKTWNYEYDYFVKDHFGNVRSVVTEEIDSNWWNNVAVIQENGVEVELCPTCLIRPKGPDDPYVTDGYTMALRTYTVTNELVNASKEEATFDNVSQTRDVKPLATNANDNKATRLNEDDGKVVGPSIMLRVTAGDKIDVSTAAYYTTEGGTDYDSHVTAEELVGGLITSLSGGGAYHTINEGGISGQVTGTALQQSDFITAMQEVKLHNVIDGQKPQAFLNYILMDENMEVVNEQSGFLQTTNPEEWNNLTVQQLDVKRTGYVIVFLSNESKMNIHFDDLSVRHFKGKLLEESHYYPYGLTITKSAFTSAAKNNNLLSGNTLNKNEFVNGKGLNWYNMDARQYDPQIGRWHSADALSGQALDWTPYRYSFSNPAMYTDETGLSEDGDDGPNGPNGHQWDCWSDRGDGGGFLDNVADGIEDAAHGIGNAASAFADGVDEIMRMEGDPDADMTGGEALENHFDTFGPQDGGPDDETGYKPLTKGRLIQYTISICPGCSPGRLQQKTGDLFENAWHNSAIVTGFEKDNYRANRDPQAGGTRTTVPDGIADGYMKPWFRPEIRVPDGAWYEVKAMNGTLYNSSNTGQVMGHITNLAATIPIKLRPGASLTFVTTDDVKIATSVVAAATLNNIIVYQYKAMYMMLGPVMSVKFKLTSKNGVGITGMQTNPVILR